MSGKGDKRRPQEVDEDTLADNWARTFGPQPADKADTAEKTQCQTQ